MVALYPHTYPVQRRFGSSFPPFDLAAPTRFYFYYSLAARFALAGRYVATGNGGDPATGPVDWRARKERTKLARNARQILRRYNASRAICQSIKTSPRDS